MEYKLYDMDKKEFKDRFEDLRYKQLQKQTNPYISYKINQIINFVWFCYKIRWLIGERLWYLKKTH